MCYFSCNNEYDPALLSSTMSKSYITMSMRHPLIGVREFD